MTNDIDVGALADAAENPTLLGVVTPPPDRDGRPFEDAHNMAVQALQLTRQRLRDLRERRGEINAEIKQLVTDEELLNRMTRVRKEAT